jgi:hypothetical protein
MLRVALIAAVIVVIAAREHKPYRASVAEKNVHKIAQTIKHSELSYGLKKAQLKNLKTIAHELKNLEESHGVKRQVLERDIQKRVSSLKEAVHRELEESTGPDMEEVVPPTTSINTRKTAVVDSELNAIQGSIATSSIPREIAHIANADIEGIRSNVHKLRYAGVAEKAKLTEAIHKRTTALHHLLEEDYQKKSHKVNKAAVHPHPHHDREKVQKIARDVHQFEENLADSFIPKAAKAEIKTNIEAILNDAKRYSSGNGERPSLKQAMELRIKALREQMKAATNGAQLEEVDADNNEEDPVSAPLASDALDLSEGDDE